MRGYRDNFLPMILHEYAARLNIKGFRIGPGDTPSNDFTQFDQQAQQYWSSNYMEAESGKAIIDAQKFGVCYLLIDPYLKSPDGAAPRITVESPLHMYCLPDPTNRYRFTTAIKQWQGTDGFVYENVYYDDHVDMYKSTSHDSIEYMQPGTGSFVQIDQVDNPLGQVPIVAIENMAQTHVWGGISDMEMLIPLQDQINTLQKNMMVASEYQAFRQRIILGVDVARDPKTDKIIDPDVVFASSRVIMIPSKDATVAEWEQMNPAVYTQVIDLAVNHLSALAKMPQYLLANKLANLSADAMRAAEQGFVDSLKQKQRWYSPGFQEGIRLAFVADKKGAQVEGQPVSAIWDTAEATSGSVLSNELVQMQALQVPVEYLWERWGMSPEDIARCIEINKQKAAQATPPPSPSALQTAGQASVKTNNFGLPVSEEPDA
jgi:hypothetical protein